MKFLRGWCTLKVTCDSSPDGFSGKKSSLDKIHWDGRKREEFGDSHSAAIFFTVSRDVARPSCISSHVLIWPPTAVVFW